MSSACPAVSCSPAADVERVQEAECQASLLRRRHIDEERPPRWRARVARPPAENEEERAGPGAWRDPGERHERDERIARDGDFPAIDPIARQAAHIRNERAAAEGDGGHDSVHVQGRVQAKDEVERKERRDALIAEVREESGEAEQIRIARQALARQVAWMIRRFHYPYNRLRRLRPRDTSLSLPLPRVAS